MTLFVIKLDILLVRKVAFHMSFCKIRTDSNNYLPLEKISTLPNVIRLITSGFNKDQNHHYHNILLLILLQ